MCCNVFTCALSAFYTEHGYVVLIKFQGVKPVRILHSSFNIEFEHSGFSWSMHSMMRWVKDLCYRSLIQIVVVSICLCTALMRTQSSKQWLSAVWEYLRTFICCGLDVLQCIYLCTLCFLHWARLCSLDKISRFKTFASVLRWWEHKVRNSNCPQFENK